MSTPRAWATTGAGPIDDGPAQVELPSGVVGNFVLSGLTVRIVFGNGAVNGVHDEIHRLGLSAVTVVCTPALCRRGARLARSISEPAAGRIMRIGSGPGADRDGDVARLVSASHGSEGFLAIGGGSAIRVARHAAGITGLPVIAVPTTYAGREMSTDSTATASAGPTADITTAPLPATVVYDPILTTTLPQHVTGVSALAAISRAALALCASDGNPLGELTAGLAIRYLAEGAHDAVLHPRGLVGRSRALYGAHLVGLITTAGARSGLAATDRVDDAIAAAGGVHTSDVAAVLLAHRLEIAGRRRPLALAAVAAALHRDDAVTGVRELAADLGAPTSFAQLGLGPGRMAAVRQAAQRLDVPQTERQALRQAIRGQSPATNRATPSTRRGEKL